MRYSFDQVHGLLYVYLRQGEIDGQVELGDGSVADIDRAGGIVGLEVLCLPEWRPDLAVKTFNLSDYEGHVLSALRDQLAFSDSHLIAVG